MSNVIITSSDMYQAFLRDIRKYRTTTVIPNLWNPFINECALDWVKSKLPLVEFNQKRIDDLGYLRIVTDGSSLTNGYPIIIEYDTDIFEIPITTNALSTDGLLICGLSQGDDFPLYLHGLTASFKRRDNDEWIPAKILKSDTKTFINKHYYRTPSATRLYFELVGNMIRLIGNTDELDMMRLEYIRYPKTINYSSGAGNLDPEFNPSQNNEIKNLAVRRYLEIIQDPRYKSFLNEEMIRMQVQ